MVALGAARFNVELAGTSASAMARRPAVAPVWHGPRHPHRYGGMCLATDLELSPERTADLYCAVLAKDGGCSCGASQATEFLGADEREALADLVRSDADNEIQMLRWLFRGAGRGGGPAGTDPQRV